VLEGLAWALRVIVTLHPSAVLRAISEGDQHFEMLVRDLVLAGEGRVPPASSSLRDSASRRGDGIARN